MVLLRWSRVYITPSKIFPGSKCRPFPIRRYWMVSRIAPPSPSSLSPQPQLNPTNTTLKPPYPEISRSEQETWFFLFLTANTSAFAATDTPTSSPKQPSHSFPNLLPIIPFTTRYPTRPTFLHLASSFTACGTKPTGSSLQTLILIAARHTEKIGVGARTACNFSLSPVPRACVLEALFIRYLSRPVVSEKSYRYTLHASLPVLKHYQEILISDHGSNPHIRHSRAVARKFRHRIRTSRR